MRLAVLLVALALPATALAAKTKVAVTEVKSVQGVAPGTATILSDIVVSEVARQGYDVISQADIASMVGFEKQKKLLGCEETGCLAEIGGALGVEYLITGQVGQIGTRFRISLLVVDSRKAKVTGRAANFCDQNEDALAKAAEATVSQLLASVRASESTQVAPAVTVTDPGKEPVAAAPPAATAATPVAAAATTSKPVTPAATPVTTAAPAPKPATPSTAAAPSPAPPPSAAPATKPVTTAGRHMTAGSWAWLGTGGALVVGGAVVAVVAATKEGQTTGQQGFQAYTDALNSKQDSVRIMAIAGTAAMGAGVVAAGVGGWLYWRSDKASVALIPMATGGGAGLLAIGSF